MRLDAIILGCALSACAVAPSRKHDVDVVADIIVNDHYNFEECYFINGRNVRFARERDFYVIELTYCNGNIKKYFADSDFKVRFLEIVRGKHVEFTDCTSRKIPEDFASLIQENFDNWLSDIYSNRN